MSLLFSSLSLTFKALTTQDLALLAMALSSGKIDYQELWQDPVRLQRGEKTAEALIFLSLA